MVDVFEEVESELRSERYQALAKRLLPWVVAGLLVGILSVAAVIGYQKYQESVANKASDSYAAGLKSLEGGDADGAFAKFGQVPAGAAGYHSLALMQQAGIRLAGGNAKQAVDLFDKAADAAPKSQIGAIIADAARLKSAFALMDQGSYPEIEARLKPLTEEGRPYRAEAREALALAKLQAGKVKEARQDFVVLSLATDAPESLKNRARTTQQMIDAGLLNNVGAVVKAASALKPVASPQLSIPGLEGLPTGPGPAAGGASMRLGRVVALSAVVAGAVLLSSCATLKRINPIHKGTKDEVAEAEKAKRVPVLALDEKLQPTSSLAGVDFALPAARAVTDWQTPSGPVDQVVENAQAGAKLQIAWRRRFGKGSDRRAHVTAPPVAAGGRVFVMDGEAQVSAIDANSGQVVWRANLNPGSRRDRYAFGGGLAIAGNRLYVASGFRFVEALDIATGKVIWKQKTISPLHDAPNVSGGRVFTISVDNQLETFDAATGAPGWKYQALIEPARILAASSPTLAGDTVVAAFSSGELVALSVANGSELWNQQLSRNSRTTALSEIRDIPGRPVIFRGDVLAGSHSGIFASVDLRTGQFRWDPLPISILGTPWAAGDVVYVTSKAGEVVCVSRSSGQVYWVRDLNAGRKQVRSSRFLGLTKVDRPYWSGPILASDRLLTVSTDGRVAAMNPRTGEVTGTVKIGDPAVMTPIAVGGQVFVVTEKAELIAIR